uniref:Uncharacterized protein n=1 Tax=Meloidogyne enterolobii TaxID=390850 RepID=A0A6V7URA1_MELEN|nr:unnamed protein product [Meloidogyne enterolobii]
MTILKILILFIAYLLIVNAKINGKRGDENFNNIQPDSNENLSNLGINSGKSGGNKKFGKNNKNRKDQKEENKELDIQSEDGSVSDQIPSSNFGDTESVDEKGEDAGSKRRRKGMIEKDDFGGKNQNRRNEDSEDLNEQNQGRINQFDFDKDGDSKGVSDSGTLNVENNEQKFNDEHLPEFLKMATIPERQKFLQLEAETDRSKSSIRKDKQNWADRQGKIISDLYKKFEQLLQQKEQQFRIERQRIAQTKLSRNAQDVDSRIQDLLKNPDIAERTLILQIERILSGTTDNIRQELQRQMPMIGPLDGNLPPTL